MLNARRALALSVTILLGASMTAAAGTRIAREPFGKMPDGRPVEAFTLSRDGGLTARISNYGGVILSLLVPDRAGKKADVVLGFATLPEYIADQSYQGALIGRYGNRIANGQFALDGKTYTLPRNNGENHLHGGPEGFHKKLWEAAVSRAGEDEVLELKYTSKDGEAGYPGTLLAKVVYALTENGGLEMRYTATTDKPTVVNLTGHSYFNLAGEGSGDILRHEIQIEADQFTPVDKTLIPTGELRAVKGTPFDLTKSIAIGAHVNDKDEQLAAGGGYDHNWVLRGPSGKLRLAVRFTDPASGRVMEVWTTEPGVQFYSGNFLDGSLKGKSGKPYTHRSGICLEPQHFPDSPNKPKFPSTVLKPGETYTHTTVYRFSAR
jgi:aldose 1-epimerase